MTGFIVSGRSIANYTARGHSLPAWAIRVDCGLCHAPMAISPSGAKEMAAARARGDHAYTVCTPCTMLLMAARRGKTSVTMSEYAAEQVVDRPEARATFDAMLDLVMEANEE